MFKKAEQLQIQGKEIHLWWTDLKKDESTYQHFIQAALSEKELIRADSFKFERDRLNFIASHGYLRLILSRYLGCDLSRIEYEITKDGKPYLKNQNFPCKICFNMSHSGNMALYAITANAEIGVDIEKINKSIKIIETIRHVLTPYEIEIFKSIDEKRKHSYFYNIWTSKEAILKATGKGLSFPLRELQVVAEDGNLLQFVSIPENEIHTSQWSLFSLNFMRGYSAAVSTNQKESIIIYKKSLD